MSAIAWLFGLGALAIAFPLIFHLIRRTPKGQTEFSSLMFLKPSPPTLTRRSRLENLLLLLMRALAIGLIAFAFMRPFFRGSDTLSEFEVANRRVAVLLDTSASMKRSDLWEQAKQEVNSVLGELEDGDDVALMTFDQSVNTVVEFDDGRDADQDRKGLVRNELESLNPGWARSDLGNALVTVADRLDVWRDSQRAKDAGASAKLQIVVVSDLQKGSKTDALQAYQWPADVFVKFQTVEAGEASNATVQLLDQISEEDEPAIRVRVVNSNGSGSQEFDVNWFDAQERKNGNAIPFYVAPGTSRVLKIEPDQVVDAQKFSVTGDAEDFDNDFYLVPTEQQELSVAYLGPDDPNDPERPQFYLDRAMIESPSRKVSVRWVKAEDDLVVSGASPPTLAVITSEISEKQKQQVESYLNSGGTVLVMVTGKKVATMVEPWIAATLVEQDVQTKPSRDNYSMLAEIDFTSELFKPFANPRFNDFTQIRFWRHRPMVVDTDVAHVLARFDNDDPAFWRNNLEGGGTVFAFSSGWHPGDSQLAISTKFVPLINSIVEIAADIPELEKSLTIGDSIVFPVVAAGVRRSMYKPDGSSEVVEAGQTRFNGVDQPGIYQLVSADLPSKPASDSVDGSGESNESNELDKPESNGDSEGQNSEGQSAEGPVENSNEIANADSGSNTKQKSNLLFAVNVDRAESLTETIPVEQLEMFQVKVGEQKTASTDLAMMREMRDRDIEDRQKFWKWLIIAAIVLLIGETWLASRTETKMMAGDAGNAETFPSNGLSGEMS